MPTLKLGMSTLSDNWDELNDYLYGSRGITSGPSRRSVGFKFKTDGTALLVLTW